MNKFQNTYRNDSTRCPGWDYGADALYFITLNTHNRVRWFGSISEGQMQLSPIGAAAQAEWERTFALRDDMRLYRGAYVVMPDHFHAVIGIGGMTFNEGRLAGTAPHNQFGPQSKNLASIVRGFKSAVTMAARAIDPAFAWQPRYHDRIIRDATALERITAYINDNPRRWNR